jgi:Domain of unknown function (DUF4249)
MGSFRHLQLQILILMTLPAFFRPAAPAIAVLTGLLFTLSSCEEVIDLDIDPAETKVVIAAEVTQGPGPHFVYLSKTVGIDDANIFPQVTGATVVLSDDAGTVDTLQELAAGTYASGHLVGVPGRSYSLSILTEGNAFTAQSTMPLPVTLDSVFNETIDFFDGIRYPVFGNFQDPAAVTNQYRYVTWVNGQRLAGSVVDVDATYNGRYTRAFIQGPGAEIALGDSVRVEMQCIDVQVYEYFSSFAQLGGGPNGSSAPANPYTNIQGGAIGYFSAVYRSEASFVVK